MKSLVGRIKGHVSSSWSRASMKVARKVLDVVVVLLRFVLKLLTRSLERQDVNVLKLRNETGWIARQYCD